MLIRNLLCAVIPFFVDCGIAIADCEVPSFNQFYGLPPGLSEADAFVGRLDYPLTTDEALPDFLNIDFTTDWERYIWAVLDYSFEGNEVVDFRVSENNVRDWYHAIWMHPARSGREAVRGLTRERASDPGQYAELLTESFPTWAIGFYNSFGATTFGRVFEDACQPDITDARFPVGTVSFKLLFTAATSDDLAYLYDAPTWSADIGRESPSASERLQDVHLLQIDVAVRDPRAGPSGWVFGTFVYNAEVASTDPWRRLRPVGLSWGNDATVLPGGSPQQNMTDPTLKGLLYGWADRPFLGWEDRLNGPADNLASSCISCHGTAQFPRSDDLGNFPDDLPENNTEAVEQRLNEYFRDISPGQVFDPTTKFFGSSVEVPAFALDYSLQLQIALERMCSAAGREDPPFDEEPVPNVCLEDTYLADRGTVAPSASEMRRQVESVNWENYIELPVR